MPSPLIRSSRHSSTTLTLQPPNLSEQRKQEQKHWASASPRTHNAADQDHRKRQRARIGTEKKPNLKLKRQQKPSGDKRVSPQCDADATDGRKNQADVRSSTFPRKKRGTRRSIPQRQPLDGKMVLSAPLPGHPNLPRLHHGLTSRSTSHIGR